MAEGAVVSYLGVPDKLIESNVVFALSPTALKIFWFAWRKHMAHWTAKKPMVIFGLSKAEIMGMGINHNHVAPALRDLRAAGLIVLIQKGYGGEAMRQKVVSQYRLAFLDAGWASDPNRSVDEWREILNKAKLENENLKTRKPVLVKTRKPVQPPRSRPGNRYSYSDQSQVPETSTLL
jgi:hypothetical protein